jgi:DNA replication and repair protein RecF
MYIDYLDIRNFRNLENVKFCPAKGLNIFLGVNGSGKTSLLEAIYLLGLGRSFRSSQIASAIQHNKESFCIMARVKQAAHLHRVGVELNSTGFHARIDGDTVRKRSQLITQMPLLYMSPYSHIILDGGPRYRRQWLDWVLFHVEPRFCDLWCRYQRVLKQRNHALRTRMPNGRRGISAWDKQLITYGEQITVLREDIFAGLQDSTSQLFRALAKQGEPVTMEFKRGWARATALEELLGEALDRDQLAGYTRYGPHRAEVVFCVGGRDVREILSRGQQKVFCYSLALGQVEVLCRIKEQDCIFLIDDFTSELDANHRERVLALLNRLGVQVFVTTVETLDSELKTYPNAKAFHVKRGRLEEMV